MPPAEHGAASGSRPSPRRTGNVLVVATVSAAFALSACSAASSEGARSDRRGPAPVRTAPDPVPTTATAGTTTPVAEAFRFSAPALGGGRVEGRDFAATGVALWFWAPG
ncbi:MAG: hypothetical protein ACKOA9_09050 [Actinomycetota bacterium]